MDAIDGRARLGNNWAADPVSKAGQFPDVPWKDMAGLRNLASHEYHRLDLEIVETTIALDLPKLIIQIDRMLSAI